MGDKEQDRYQLASIAAEAMCLLMEVEYEQGERDLDAMMRRLKDLSAYSLTHAEIMEQREGVELLALGRFFGMSGGARLTHNQARLSRLSEESLAYQGQAEVVEVEVAARKGRQAGREREAGAGVQPRLF